ncbi:MAG: flavodoxin domain-containing protein [Oscillospiraceae bacterium]|nr:flavodoxin domain-containing protein [Oscillospiraceae bacterium]
MKAIVIYNSKTGFTKKYAKWIAEALQCQSISIREKLPDLSEYDRIVFGSNVKAGKIAKLDYFRKNILPQNKQTVLFAVGVTPTDNPQAKALFKDNLTENELNTVKAFYLQGGISYEKLNFFEKRLMKMIGNSMLKKENATEQEKQMGKAMLTSFDNSSKESITPIIKSLREQEENLK